MLHHACSPLGAAAGRFVRSLLKEFSLQKGIFVDFVCVSPSNAYQATIFGERVTAHRLNVYKGKSGQFSMEELFEYQAKSYIFILRTSRKIKYDLIHALGLFPESCTAYAFRIRFPYCVSLLPTDSAAASILTGGRPESLESFGKEIMRSAKAVFDHTAGFSKLAAPIAARKYLEAYRTITR